MWRGGDGDGKGLEGGKGGEGRLLLAFVHSCVRTTILGKGDYKGQPVKGDRVKNTVPSTS